MLLSGSGVSLQVVHVRWMDGWREEEEEEEDEEAFEVREYESAAAREPAAWTGFLSFPRQPVRRHGDRQAAGTVVKTTTSG